MKYVTHDGGVVKEGEAEIESYKNIQIGDLVVSQKEDETTGLPIYFPVEKKGKWGGFDFTLMTSDEKWKWIAEHDRIRFVIIRCNR